MNANQSNEIWNEFLKNWPIDKVKSMDLEQYTKSGEKTTFTYWVEVGTRDIAEIRGSTALKFGIYNRKDTTKKFIASGIICDSQYAWYGKYGLSKDEAFQNIKNNILKVIEAAQAQDTDLISKIDISPMVKWKIAFLYQNRNNPIILPIFSLKWLKSITKNNSTTYPLAYSQLKEQMGNQQLFDYTHSLVERYKQSIPAKEQDVNSQSEDADDLNINIVKQPLNQILFGPAGTGKTYHTIDHALKILDPSLIEELESEDNSYDRETLKNKFDEFVAKGQVKFVTFHQSFSYEDFIEGIRAESIEAELENGNKIKNLEYPVIDGVFLELCNSNNQTSNSKYIGTEFLSNHFISIYNDERIEIKKPMGALVSFPTAMILNLIQLVKDQTISINDIKSKNTFIKLEELHIEPARILEKFIINGYNNIVGSLVEYLINNEEKNQNNVIRPLVIIIDEINRGNISKIFGELITLIEPDKRKGEAEEISVILPYSKRKFSVPNNVYIIGTMNSSDRSLTGIDIALRRRFTFIEMPSKPELLNDIHIEGINLGDLLNKINRRIEVLLDKEHCIGHANFMSLNHESSIQDLAHIFKRKVLPLLQEYFFEDWSKINMVFNDNDMLTKESVSISELFNNINDDDLSYYENRELWKINDSAFKDVQSYLTIIK